MKASRRVLISSVVAVVASAVGVPLGALAVPAHAHRPTAAGCQAGGSWPMYQADPAHTADACSQIATSNVSQLRPSWFVSTPGTVSDTPAVAFGSVFAGDSTGAFYALDRATGAVEWTFRTTAAHSCFLDAPRPHADTHQTGFGEITASPATATIGGQRVVFVGAGASLFALDAGTGRCLWAQDTDPGRPSDAVEIESSPVVDTATNPPEVLVGNDDNSSPGIAVTGLQAFDATTGALLWKYEPERDLTLYPREFGGSDALTLSCGDGSPNPYCNPATIPGLAPNSTTYADACGDVWSSPALDTTFTDPAGGNSFEGSGSVSQSSWAAKRMTATGGPSHDGLVVFGTGNCGANPDPATALAHGDYVDNNAIFALDPVTGVRVWNFVAPYNAYDSNPNEPGGGDDDFGSSPVLARLAAGTVKGCPSGRMVIEGSKSGYAYGLCETGGTEVWQNQVAQPGQGSPDSVGSIGGMIGSPSLGLAGGRPTVFFTSAQPLPFTNDGVRFPGDGDANIARCPGLSSLPLLPACPDLGLLANPQRLASLHAVDAATGRLVYQVPSPPTYSASTYTGGVVFMPDSFASAVAAFDADNGQPLWAFPLGAVPASGVAIAGRSVYLGTGESDGSTDGIVVPPQATGIWSFTLPARTAR